MFCSVPPVKNAKPSPGAFISGGVMVDFCVDLLSLFLLPFQDFFFGSVFASVVMIVLISFPILGICRIFRFF